MYMQPQFSYEHDDHFAQRIAHSMQGYAFQAVNIQKSTALFHRQRDSGSWFITIDQQQVSIDELSVGANAARHLATLHCQQLCYVGPNNNNLRWRGFAIAAQALQCNASILDQHNSASGPLGIFADGAAAEKTALRYMQQHQLRAASDVLIIGIEDGYLPMPTAAGISRLHIDPSQVCQAIDASC